MYIVQFEYSVFTVCIDKLWTLPHFIQNLHQNQAQQPHLLSFIQEVWPSVQRFNKWLSRAHSLTAYECPMNRDAYLTGSTSLQHLCYKLHSCRAIPSLTVAGPSVQTALIIRTIGQSVAISDTATKDNEGRSTPVYLFQVRCPWLFKFQTFLSQHIFPDQPSSFFFLSLRVRK